MNNTIFIKFLLLTILVTFAHAVPDYTGDGEELNNIHNTTGDATDFYTESQSPSTTKGPDNYSRYFKFKTLATGAMTITQSNNRNVGGYKNHMLKIGTSFKGKDIHDGASKQNDSANFIALANTTYYVRIQEGNYKNQLNVDLTFSFIKTPVPKCSNPKQFSLRTKQVLAGDLVAIGNSSICADDDKDGSCDAIQTVRNDTNNIIHVTSSSSSDIAASDEPTPLSDGNLSMNISSAKLDLPDNTKIRWAGLYWQGEVWDTKTETGQKMQAQADKIKFKIPGDVNFRDITADEHHYIYVKRKTNQASADYYGVTRYEEHYQGFKDVTAIMKNLNGSHDGNYTVANIQATVGKLWYPGAEAAWSLQIIYEDPTANPRSISITDGYVSLYASGGDGVNYANEVNSAYGLSCTTDKLAMGTLDHNITFTVDGFITPKTSGIKTDMSLFITESDPDSGGSVTQEFLTITKKDGSPYFVETSNAWNYEITHKNGTNNTDRTPAYIYPIGMTIKNYELFDALDTEQTSTDITFNTSNDRLMLGVIGFATDLRSPNLCYDYGYEQNGIPFTEDNNGTQEPRITGFVTDNGDINVSLYIRNTELSDILASNISIDIADINNSQARYVPDTISIRNPGEFAPLNDTDSNWGVTLTDNGTTNGIDNIPLDDMDAQEAGFVYYSLRPQSGIINNEINVSIDATVSYTLTIPIPGFDPIDINYTSKLGDSNVKICNGANSSYKPEWGIFNIVEPSYYANGKYNLTTQVVNRAGVFQVASFDADAANTPKATTSYVSIELIDAGLFHDANASCLNPNSAVSPQYHLWVMNSDGTDTSQIDITAGPTGTLLDSSGEHVLQDTYNQMFKQATRETAWRVWFLLNPLTGDPLELECSGTPYRWNLWQEPLKSWVQSSSCSSECNSAASGNFCDRLTGNSSGKGDSSCLACLSNLTKYPLCSRDNFSIRPESFDVKLSDVNQTNVSLRQLFATDRTGQPSANTADVNLSAGYNYHYDINATSHTSNSATLGYTRYFGNNNAEYNATLIYSPLTALTCNDTNDYVQSFNMINGTISQDANHTQVGRYKLNIIDKTWTSIDWDLNDRTHQTDEPSYFVTATSDCAPDSSDIQVQGTTVSNYSTMVGCDINSTHTTSEKLNSTDSGNTQYRDYNMVFRPYQFDISTITLSHGLNQDVNFVGPLNGDFPFVYMANLNNTDENMSVQFRGNIIAQGYDGGQLSNFVENCYAEPLNFDVNKTFSVAALPQDGANYTFLFKDFNTTDGSELNAAQNGIINDPLINTIVTIGTNSFPTVQAGLANVALMLNFDRNVSREINPINVTFNDLNISCQTLGNCQSQADFSPVHDVNGTQLYTANNTVVHYYGQIYAPSYTVFTDDMNATISYNVFCQDAGTNACNAINYPNLVTMTDAPNTLFYKYNADHNDTRDGQLSAIVQNTGIAPNPVLHQNLVTPINTNSANGTVLHNLLYDGSQGYSYISYIQVTAPNFLLYNSAAPAIIPFEFPVRFMGTGLWSGVNEHNVSNSKIDSGINTNRRINW